MKTLDRGKPSAALLIHELADLRQKGVAEVKPLGPDIFEVLSVEEKPEVPKTNMSLEPIYIFEPDFFKVLEKTKPGKGGEIQVTDAIQLMINEGHKVYATKLLENEIRLDVGDAESYWDALSVSHNLSTVTSGGRPPNPMPR